MTRSCRSCGTALSRYNDCQLCFACQVEARSAEQNSVVMTARQIQQVPRQPIVIEIRGTSKLNPRKQNPALKNPRISFSISTSPNRI